MARIFISHSSKDKKPAQELKNWLASIGFEQTFLDFDKHSGIPPGAQWERTLYRELERTQAVILVLTKHWYDSKWCFAEFTQARALGKAIFALIEAPSGEAAIVSSDIQHLDLIVDREAGLESLSRELTRVALSAQGGFNWDTGRAPYPGLLSFDAQDAAIFFGRDDDVLRAVERLNARRVHGGEKGLVILGGSGSGKSSLLKAGIVPRIARDKTNFLVAPPFRPESDPIGNLLGALQSIDLTLTRADLVGIDGPSGGRALIQRLRIAAKVPQATLIVAIDQAEEVFANPDGKIQEAFFNLLSSLLASDNPALGLWTLRSDHLSDLQTAEHLLVDFEQFSLKPMPIDRLGMIVNGPADIAGLSVEKGLVPALMRDATTQDSLPLVAFVLRRLYDRRGGETLTQAHYEAMRDGNLSPLEVAVRDAANEAMARRNPTDEAFAALREAFVPSLVRINDEGGFVRQSAKLELLPPAAHGLLRALANARLLVVDKGMVEVAHEALFRVWPRLAQWLEEEREFLVGKSRIEKSREDYSRLPEPVRTKGLLSGILLERAKDWLTRHPQRFSTDEAAFIRLSIDEAEFQERERAAQREKLRQAELAHAKAVAERATQEAVATRRFLRFAVGAACVLALLGATAVYYWRSADAAQKEAKVNFILAIDQAVAHVDLVIDSYQAGRISTSLMQLLTARSQATVDRLQSDARETAAAKVKLLRAVSRAHLVLSQPTLAEQNARESLEITQRFVALKDIGPEWMQLHERTQHQLGQSLFWKGDLGEALLHLRAAKAGAQVLVDTYPGVKDYAYDLIEIHRFIGDCLRNQANIDQAHAEYRAWLDLAERLSEQQPDEAQWIRSKMFARQRMGDVLLAQNRPPEAGVHFQMFFSLATEGLKRESDNKEFAEAVSIAHERLGDVHFAQNEMKEALERYRAFKTTAEKLATADRSNFIWNQNLEIAHQRIGEVHLQQGQFDDALKEFTIYMQMASDTLEKDQEHGAALFDLANALQKVGDALHGRGNHREAMHHYREMHRHMLTLKKKDRSNAIWNKSMALSHQRIGRAFEALGEKTSALASFEECAKIVVPAALWDLRNVGARDVTEFCRNKAAELR